MTECYSFCRTCHNNCPVVVDVQDGKLSKITGDPTNEVFSGYTCIKGRAQTEIIHHPDRLLHSQKKMRDGSFEAIPVEAAMDEIAAKLTDIIDRGGVRSVATYSGTMHHMNMVIGPFLKAFMRALGSPMLFASSSIDKPGRLTAKALHGQWMAPPQGFHEPDVALLVGLNPFQSHYGVAMGHPARWLSERMRNGMKVIVIDPRKSDIAKRATLHLQPVPGEDPAIFACLINIIITEGLYNSAFVAQHVNGLEELTKAVASFTPDVVARRAGVPAEDLVTAARLYATAERGYSATGVGPSFSSSSTLVHYLSLDLVALCGHYFRAGEQVTRTVVLHSRPTFKAQAASPTPAFDVGEKLRVHGLAGSVAGLPTGVLADEILLEGEGQVKSLISCGGNPLTAWPDQLKTIEALKSLELLVQFDPWMSETASVADYVIAPTMSYEVPGATLITDELIAQEHWYGPAVAYGQYTPAIIEPPATADVIDEWAFFYGLAQRMNLQLDLGPSLGKGRTDGALDMQNMPTTDGILELMTSGSRIPFAEVKRHPRGASFIDPPEYVGPGDPDWSGRLDLANEMMMRDLAEILAIPVNGHSDQSTGTDAFPYRLINHRIVRTFNSSDNFPATNRGRGYNPALMHPKDLEDLGLNSGDAIEITSPIASIRAVVEADTTLRRGVVSMTHGFGGTPDRDDKFKEIGSPTNRLLDSEDFADPHVGMPRMGGISIAVRALH